MSNGKAGDQSPAFKAKLDPFRCGFGRSLCITDAETLSFTQAGEVIGA